MEPITIRDILTAVKGRILGDFENLDLEISRVETDSRTIHEGSLFVPLIGEQFDGHAYITAALEGGAAACFTQRDRESYLPGKCYIRVDHTQRALRELAVWYKKKFDIPVVAVTGSVGKTTTKDMVAAVLGERYKVLKTEGNLNTDIGTCRTLFRLDKSYEIAVLEMGMNHPGEIEVMSAIVQPDVCLITNIGDSHIEHLGSRENILKAKCEIFSHAKPGCLAVLNGDDPLLRTLEGKLPGPILWCGGADGLDYTADNLVSDGTSNVRCEVKTPHSSCQVEIPALGSHMIYPTLMAAAVAEHFGVTAEEFRRGVLHFAPTKMRMNIIQRGEDITILNDTYNANPQSMRAAVEVLSKTHGSPKIAVLGDMFELGTLAPALHAGIGTYLGKAGIDCLVAVGELARNIYDAAAEAKVPEIHYCATKQEALPILAQVVKPHATILVKASRGMAFEDLTEYLKSITQEP
ncbi:UDP-N-acetylmuramoyl-tripeptide--D-alanyl-D-alanine ligase [uncultured Pseudoflavonifractor sp.]|uniref:UDP-N-acetylmuramoyl-tripeptide--D-alanyl-D- alanine ligase n=1 Tax=uncultured Pseudoflavonifractor sp. TaxID=1221379 RepID=UPI0025CE83B3|nr:UDP-N-acetylmuramoyl-tripeptide--D-alanyl-D-alanine ligase [uncultured Pseudoflavonifractor sp.]